MTCRAICKKYKQVKTKVSDSWYDGKNKKRCTQCGINIIWEGVHCPCCGLILRVHLRTGLNRKKQLELKIRI